MSTESTFLRFSYLKNNAIPIVSHDSICKMGIITCIRTICRVPDRRSGFTIRLIREHQICSAYRKSNKNNRHNNLFNFSLCIFFVLARTSLRSSGGVTILKSVFSFVSYNSPSLYFCFMSFLFPLNLFANILPYFHGNSNFCPI